MGQLFNAITLAFTSIWGSKLRSALTMLGMIIGVAAVVALLAVGRGTQEGISAQIRSIGTNVVFITPGAARTGGVSQAAGTRPTLTYEDALAIETSDLTGIAAVVPERTSNVQAIAGANNVNTRVTGTTPDYQLARNAIVASGTFFDDAQLDAAESVVVLGSSVATNLFGATSPVGQTLTLVSNQQRVLFRVIGVLEAKGGTGFGNSDDLILIPYTTMTRRFGANYNSRGERTVSQITLQLVDEATTTRAQATSEVTSLLLTRHRVTTADFTIQSQEDLISTITSVTGTFTTFMAAVAGISLIVGGIGIMNIMTVSVTERTREIGLRKAVGAKKNDILLQFLIESLVVSVLGGGIGIAIGAGGALAFTSGASRAVVTPDSIALAFGVSAAIGLFFGIYPAARAANLHPIQALRYE